MAKIIVEQVQGGSGGTALTVPTAAATVNNQAVVGSTAGVLSHSPIALPAAASGAAQSSSRRGNKWSNLVFSSCASSSRRGSK